MLAPSIFARFLILSLLDDSSEVPFDVAAAPDAFAFAVPADSSCSRSFFVGKHVQTLCASTLQRLPQFKAKLLCAVAILSRKSAGTSFLSQLKQLFALSFSCIKLPLKDCFSYLPLVVTKLQSFRQMEALTLHPSKMHTPPAHGA